VTLLPARANLGDMAVLRSLVWLAAAGAAAAEGASCGCAASRSTGSASGGSDQGGEPGTCGGGGAAADVGYSAAAAMTSGGSADSGGDGSGGAAEPAPAAAAAAVAASPTLEPPPPPPSPPDVVRVPAGSTQLGDAGRHFPADAEGPPFAFYLRKPLWMDRHEVSNARFAAFTAATGYVTEAESYGWSFVHELAIPQATRDAIDSAVAGLEWWLPVPNASWITPEGAGTHVGATSRWGHPVQHVSQRDAAAFCAWAGGRLPSEDEWCVGKGRWDGEGGTSCVAVTGAPLRPTLISPTHALHPPPVTFALALRVQGVRRAGRRPSRCHVPVGPRGGPADGRRGGGGGRGRRRRRHFYHRRRG
jgi:hypothetical protein